MLNPRCFLLGYGKPLSASTVKRVAEKRESDPVWNAKVRFITDKYKSNDLKDHSVFSINLCRPVRSAGQPHCCASRSFQRNWVNIDSRWLTAGPAGLAAPANRRSGMPLIAAGERMNNNPDCSFQCCPFCENQLQALHHIPCRGRQRQLSQSCRADPPVTAGSQHADQAAGGAVGRCRVSAHNTPGGIDAGRRGSDDQHPQGAGRTRRGAGAYSAGSRCPARSVVTWLCAYGGRDTVACLAGCVCKNLSCHFRECAGAFAA